MKRYLASLLLAALLMLLGVGAFNWWADPYGIWRAPDAEQLNRNRQVFFLRLSKPWQVSRIKPTAVIIGSSRSGSIDPATPVWAGETGYNFALHGLTLFEMQRVIEHTQAQGRLKKLFIAIEFDTFIAAQPKAGLGFDEDRMQSPQGRVPRWKALAQKASDMRDTLLTSSTLALSLQAALGTAPPGRAMQPDGSWRYTALNRTGREGYSHAGKLLVRRVRDTERGTENNLALLADVLAFCHRHGIDTRLYFSPEHLFMTDLRQHIGYGPERDEFMRQVVAINEAVAAKAGRQAFPLWGFNQWAGVVDEPLHAGQGSLDDWFRDGFHFYTKLGDRIMAQAWGSDGQAGRALTLQTIDDYLAQVEALRLGFVAEQAELVQAYRANILGQGVKGPAAR